MAASNLQEFITEWTGKMIPFQDVPAGSCMAVPHQYIYEVLGLTNPLIISGEFAYEVYTNFSQLPAAANFVLVQNSLTNVPDPGDIVIFGQNATDTPQGHICVFVSGDVNSFVSFDQDYPYGSTPHLQNHVYTGTENVLGWLHYNPPGTSATTNVQVTDTQSTDLLNAQIAATSQCQSQLSTANATISGLQTQQQKDQDLIQSLQDEKSEFTTQITALQAQLGNEQKEIVNLNTQIETQASSNKDYATEILTLSHDNTSLNNSLNSIVDGLGVSRTAKTLDQITAAALSKEDELDTLLKAAGIVEGLLHNMAKTLQLDDPNATDQQVANNIITYVKSLQGKLQNLVPQKPAFTVTTTSNQNIFSKIIGWFWIPKTS